MWEQTPPIPFRMSRTSLRLSGGEGNDTLVGGTPGPASSNGWLTAVIVDGGTGNDLIQGGNRRAMLWGCGRRYDTGWRGPDKIYADGDDVLIDGGDGGAIVYFTSSALVRLGGVAGPGEVLMRNVSILQLPDEFMVDVRASADWASSITVSSGDADDDVTTGSGDDVIYLRKRKRLFRCRRRQRHAQVVSGGGSIDLRITTSQAIGSSGFGTFLNFENIDAGNAVGGTVWGTEGANRLEDKPARFTGSAATIPMSSMAKSIATDGRR